jgi:hypothetical protein
MYIYMNICIPALLYLILSLFGIFITLFIRLDIKIALIHLIFAIVWTYILHLLCSFGYEIISWILVLFPFIIFLIIVIFQIKK